MSDSSRASAPPTPPTPPLAPAAPALSPAAADAPSEPLCTFELSLRQVAVRPLRAADNRALEWHGGPDLRSFYEWQWQEHEAGRRLVLVADFNRFPIGQLAIQWRGKPTHPHLPDIQSLRVIEIFRGLGIGSQLLRAGERLAAQRGCTQISISVGIDNPHARRLYERSGYVVVGNPYRDGWSYTDRHGEPVRVEETILDLVKDLANESTFG